MLQVSRLIEVEQHVEASWRTESQSGFVVFESLEHCLGSKAVEQHRRGTKAEGEDEEPTQPKSKCQCWMTGADILRAKAHIVLRYSIRYRQHILMKMDRSLRVACAARGVSKQRNIIASGLLRCYAG